MTKPKRYKRFSAKFKREAILRATDHRVISLKRMNAPGGQATIGTRSMPWLFNPDGVLPSPCSWQIFNISWISLSAVGGKGWSER